MALVFNMGSQSRLSESIEGADTSIKLNSYDTMLEKGGSGDSYYAQMINAEGEREIVLVDVGNSDAVQGLSVTRGVEGSSAQAWGAGTIIWQILSETTMEAIEQQAVARQVAFIPDGVLTSNYNGEKVYQTDLALWWKAVGSGTTEWRLIAGEVFTADVVFAPASSPVAPGTSLTMTCLTPGASIYYTTDGSDPDETDTLYTAPVEIPDPGPTTFKAKAYGSERWRQPSINIKSTEYTVVTPTSWSNQSMATILKPHIIYSTGSNSLLLLQMSELLQPVGSSWVQVVAPYYSPDYGYHNEYLLEDGSTIWMVGETGSFNNVLLYTTTPTLPAWTAYVTESNTVHAGDIRSFHHITKFGSDLYISAEAESAPTFWHGLWRVTGVDSLQSYSRYSTGDDVALINPPVELGGYLYALVESGTASWVNNLLRLDSGTATRLTTATDALYGLFVYNSQLHAWGTDGSNNVVIYRFNGVSAWVAIKTVARGEAGTPEFHEKTVQVGNLFYNIDGPNSNLWRWNPASDTLLSVASNITDSNTAHTNQPLAWDTLGAPATMWLTPGVSENKTWKWV